MVSELWLMAGSVLALALVLLAFPPRFWKGFL